MIPYGRHDISIDDINSLVEVLKSDFITQGPIVAQFERKMQIYCGASYSVAVNSATSALHIACKALNVTNNDIVWTSPISFVASSNAALYCGATVDFVDIDFETNNISLNSLEEKLVYAERNGLLPKVLIAVHMGGYSCDMEHLFYLSKKYGFRIIEDASHAVGGKYKHKPIGSCQFSDITVFSFHPVKIITTGEGGMALTNDKKLHEKMLLFQSHGVTRDKEVMSKKTEGDWYYEQVELGHNYRMTEMQAALGVSQMDRLDHFVNLRNKLSKIYDERFRHLPVSVPKRMEDILSSYHLYIIKLNSNSAKQRRVIFDYMRSNDIGVHVHYIPIHLQPYYQKIGFRSGQFPNAEKYYESALSLPLHHNLSENLIDKVVNSLEHALQLEYDT